MRVLLLVIACAIWMTAGCGSSGSAQAKVDPAAPAGEVREVAGTVTGMLAGERRALVVGDTVAAGELIETGSDGNVVIELRHNQVRWQLGPSQARKPIDAAAWTAAAPSQRVEPGGDRTAAAGRLAEREGADTAASAARPIDGEDGAGPGSGATTDVPEIAKPEKPDPVVRDHRKDKPRPKDDPKPDKSNDDEVRTKGGCDEVACVLDPSAACCARRKGGGGSVEKGTGGGGSSVPETLERTAVTSTMAKIKARLVACGAQHAGTRVKLRITVAPGGSVSSVTVDGGDDALSACLRGVVEGARFPPSQQGGTFSYPLAF